MANNKHIQEKSVIEHLAKARQKGYLASVELHNYGFSSKLFSFTDSFRDALVIFALVLLTMKNVIWPVAIGLALWKGLKITLQGFMRLEKLHLLIREEKYEIDHHRDEERQELLAIYEAKGFKGPILEEVVATLMADDNRLLQVMLEEELGVSFEILDHPVVSGAMSALGVMTAVGTTLLLNQFQYGLIGGILALVAIISLYETKKQKLPTFHHLVWSIASVLFVFAVSYFIHQRLG